MKGTIAVMLDLAGQLGAPRYDLTWVFYAREEITRSESGLLEIKSLRPDLLRGDVAILGEPTKAKIEAGCQGTLRVTAKLSGRSAHTARPWKGLNAIHRLGALIEDLSRLERRKVEIQGVGYAEQVEAVKIGGGHANNSVPDEAWITINYRFAPDRSIDQAIAWLSESLLSRHLNESADSLSIDDAAEGALPSLDDPVIEALLAASGGDVSAKLGWTDVATFAGLGIPAVNFGAGDPELAHHVEEYVAEADLVNVHGALKQLLS
jgi:succinyl-diaminopimelate desuccinylase